MGEESAFGVVHKKMSKKREEEINTYIGVPAVGGAFISGERAMKTGLKPGGKAAVIGAGAAGGAAAGGAVYGGVKAWQRHKKKKIRKNATAKVTRRERSNAAVGYGAGGLAAGLGTGAAYHGTKAIKEGRKSLKNYTKFISGAAEGGVAHAVGDKKGAAKGIETAAKHGPDALSQGKLAAKSGKKGALFAAGAIPLAGIAAYAGNNKRQIRRQRMMNRASEDRIVARVKRIRKSATKQSVKEYYGNMPGKEKAAYAGTLGGVLGGTALASYADQKRNQHVKNAPTPLNRAEKFKRANKATKGLRTGSKALLGVGIASGVTATALGAKRMQPQYKAIAAEGRKG